MSLVLGGALRALSLGSHLSPFSLSYMRPREKRILLGSPALCTGADGSSPSWAPGPVAKASPSLLCVRGVAPHFTWCRGHSEKPHHWLASRAHQSQVGSGSPASPQGSVPSPCPVGEQVVSILCFPLHCCLLAAPRPQTVCSTLSVMSLLGLLDCFPNAGAPAPDPGCGPTDTSLRKATSWKRGPRGPPPPSPTQCPGGPRASSTGRTRCSWTSSNLSTSW